MSITYLSTATNWGTGLRFPGLAHLIHPVHFEKGDGRAGAGGRESLYPRGLLSPQAQVVVVSQSPSLAPSQPSFNPRDDREYVRSVGGLGNRERASMSRPS